jgi:hypothetical protein
MTLSIDLTALVTTMDSELLQRVDRRVASYYLAMPLAGEDNQVTVATAYPDNAAALRVLARLLHADVVAVQTPESQLQQAIAQVYPAAAPTEGVVLAWADDPAWADAVITAAEIFGRAVGREVITLPPGLPFDEALAAAGRGVSVWVACCSDEHVARLVRQSPTSLLLVRGDYRPVDRVLLALRGFASDHAALERVFPILAREGISATVLPLMGSAEHSALAHAGAALAGDSPAQQHLRGYLGRRDTAAPSVSVAVRLSQGGPAQQIVNELATGRYGLLVIAAEAEGEFVRRVLSRIEQAGVWPDGYVLVIKPPLGITN